nr:hypothetical protein [uncultured Prevotella sp.]
MEATRCFTSLLKLFIWITIFLIFSCSPSRKHELDISANILCGKWSLEGEEKRVNYPEMEFCKDRTAVLYSQADTIYRFTFYTRNDTLFLVDVNGNVVGNNRPDVQFDKHGVHTNVEYDTQTRFMNKHKEQLPKNDNQARNKFYKVNGK